MGGSAIYVKNGKLSLKKFNYAETGKGDALEVFDFKKSLETEDSSKDVDGHMNDLTNAFPKTDDNPNINNDELQYLKDLCSLYDSAHDFGGWKINYDILQKKKDTEEGTYDRMSFLIQGIQNYGLSINNELKMSKFYTTYSNINTASLGGGTIPSIITSKELENLFLFQAMEYASRKDKKTGNFMKLCGKNYTKIEDSHRLVIEEFFREYRVNPENGDPIKKSDKSFVIPVVIDANKRLFKSKDDELWENFCYLLTQEGIADPSPKKNPLKASGLRPFGVERFYFETNNTDNTRKYDIDNVSGIFEPSFGVMNNFEVTQTYKCLKNDGTQEEITKPILLNQTKHPNSIDILRRRYNRDIAKEKKLKFTLKTENYAERDVINNIYSTLFEKSDTSRRKVQLNTLKFGDGKISEDIIIKTIDIFTSKRFGDQLQANCVRYINTWKKAKNQKGIEFQNLSGKFSNFKPQRAVLVTHDRMLFAYAIYNNIPVIFDYGKILLLYKPNSQTEILPQNMRTSMSGGSFLSTFGFGETTAGNKAGSKSNKAGSKSNEPIALTNLKNSVANNTLIGKLSSTEILEEYNRKLNLNYRTFNEELTRAQSGNANDYSFDNIDPSLLLSLYFEYALPERKDDFRIMMQVLSNILKKIYICSNKNLNIEGDTTQYVSNLPSSDENIKINVDLDSSEFIISDYEKEIITKGKTIIGEKRLALIKSIKNLKLIKNGAFIELKLNDTFDRELTGYRTTSHAQCIGVLKAFMDGTTLKFLQPEEFAERTFEERRELLGGHREFEFFKLLKYYETKLLLDNETLNKDFTKYYVDENKPETNFYLYDELILHTFLNKLSNNKYVHLVDFDNITNCLAHTEKNHVSKQIRQNASNLLSIINIIEEYVYGGASTPKLTIKKETYAIVQNCLINIHNDVAEIDNKVLSLEGIKLLNFVFDNNLTNGSLKNLVNIINYNIEVKTTKSLKELKSQLLTREKYNTQSRSRRPLRSPSRSPSRRLRTRTRTRTLRPTSTLQITRPVVFPTSILNVTSQLPRIAAGLGIPVEKSKKQKRRRSKNVGKDKGKRTGKGKVLTRQKSKVRTRKYKKRRA